MDANGKTLEKIFNVTLSGDRLVDAKALGVETLDELQVSMQNRALDSPIWHTPN